MAEARATVAQAPIWVDLASADPNGSTDFYAALFGWKREVPPDPESGGYGIFMLGDKAVSGVGPTQGASQPTAWAVYIGTEDADETARRAEAAGGKVVAPPFDVLKAGRMAVFQDPSGALISVWQPVEMPGADVMRVPNSVGWAELNSRDVGAARPFYRDVFGWSERESPMGDGVYVEFQAGGESVAGATQMAAEVPAEVPSFWLVYFLVEDIDARVERVRTLGGTVQMGPAEYPGGRFAVLADPQGAVFGLISA